MADKKCSVYSVSTGRMCPNEVTGLMSGGGAWWPACDEHKDRPPIMDPIDRIRAECGLPLQEQADG